MRTLSKVGRSSIWSRGRQTNHFMGQKSVNNQDKVDALLDLDRLTPWEQDFLTDIDKSTSIDDLTERQQEALDGMYFEGRRGGRYR